MCILDHFINRNTIWWSAWVFRSLKVQTNQTSSWNRVYCKCPVWRHHHWISPKNHSLHHTSYSRVHEYIRVRVHQPRERKENLTRCYDDQCVTLLHATKHNSHHDNVWNNREEKKRHNQQKYDVKPPRPSKRFPEAHMVAVVLGSHGCRRLAGLSVFGEYVAVGREWDGHKHSVEEEKEEER